MLYALAREVTPKERRELQDRAIDEALAMQERGGVDVVTDGELRRIQFFDQFVVGIDGLAPGPGGSAKFHSDDGQTVEFRVPVCVQSRIKATRNLALEESTYIKDKIRRAVHLCRGNYAGMWTARGGYEDLARSCFGRAPNVDVWMMEYDDDRSGGFEPLRELPADKTAVLGLITTKRPALEDPDRLRTRIEEAAEFHPREQLGISTQCGFESGTNAPLRLGEQEAKLSLVADIAHSVWAGARR
jgi:methionine synthase II (cobalamin-independent)